MIYIFSNAFVRAVSDVAAEVCRVRKKLKKHFKFDRQDRSQFIRHAVASGRFEHIGEKDRIPDGMTCERKTIGSSSPIHLGRGRFHAGTAKPVSCVIEVVVDAMDHSVDIRCIAGGKLLHDTMRLIQSACQKVEQTAYAFCL